MPRSPDATSLLLSREHEASLRAHAELAFPRESCGLLLGFQEGERLNVRRVLPAPNGAADATTFRIHPRQVLGAMRRARRDGCVLVGAYHSHPGGSAAPSGTDTRDAWGELVHLIVACNDGNAESPRAWRLDGSRATEITIDLVGGGESR